MSNPHTARTMTEAVSRIARLPVRPAFVIHTGDISHLSKPAEFDTAEQIIKAAHSDVHYVPGEHDWLDDGQAYMERHGQATWHAIERDMRRRPSCPKLESYWHFRDCRYNKSRYTCGVALLGRRKS